MKIIFLHSKLIKNYIITPPFIRKAPIKRAEAIGAKINYIVDNIIKIFNEKYSKKMN